MYSTFQLLESTARAEGIDLPLLKAALNCHASGTQQAHLRRPGISTRREGRYACPIANVSVDTLRIIVRKHAISDRRGYEDTLMDPALIYR